MLLSTFLWFNQGGSSKNGMVDVRKSSSLSLGFCIHYESSLLMLLVMQQDEYVRLIFDNNWKREIQNQDASVGTNLNEENSNTHSHTS